MGANAKDKKNQIKTLGKKGKVCVKQQNQKKQILLTQQSKQKTGLSDLSNNLGGGGLAAVSCTLKRKRGRNRTKTCSRKICNPAPIHSPTKLRSPDPQIFNGTPSAGY